MSSVDIAVACALLSAAAILFIFNVKPDASDSAPHRTKLDQLLERRDAIYENLRDLRFEFRAGKFSEHDFEEIKQSLEVEAARVLAEMDQLTGGTPTPATRQASMRQTPAELAATEKVRNS
ncbi:MAG: hypothetical protein WA211_15615 [Candidatus Acidiferrales bacterium]